MTDGPRHRVLVVEDDPGVRQLIGSHLKRKGYEPITAESAEAVLEQVRAGELEYDVALTDVHLPGMTGVELNRLLLATSPLSPIIVITGDDDAELARRALQEGATGYLLKPFELFARWGGASRARGCTWGTRSPAPGRATVRGW